MRFNYLFNLRVSTRFEVEVEVEVLNLFIIHTAPLKSANDEFHVPQS